MAASENEILFQYKFLLDKGLEKEFNLILDRDTLNLKESYKKDLPLWTVLTFRQCPICPLTTQTHQHCPIAVNLVDVVSFFSDSLSYEEVELYIKTDARNFVKKTSLQQGISSLIGIYMVTSGCPIMDKLKPMVRFHLPFSTIEETKYRAMSMYLMAQYFLYKEGEKPDWDMKYLSNIYDDIKVLNMSFAQRLAGIGIQDATANALVELDCFAENIRVSISKDKMDEIKGLFKSYLDKTRKDRK
ncbi:MAG: hypothetical protein D6734_08415 [Candidatus Schekmanbacteria bacterium]|nr:MAG: hypothetical protein D6734_08415 [Candidatus Schekmanbacteria bacterium]